jgi:hypothetical protein
MRKGARERLFFVYLSLFLEVPGCRTRKDCGLQFDDTVIVHRGTVTRLVIPWGFVL